MSKSTLTRSMLPGIVASTALIAASAFLGSGVASAHVSVSSTTATQGGYGLVTLLVPNESDTAATTSVSIEVPHLKSVRTEAMPGWRAVIEKDPKTLEALRVTWTAADGNAGLQVGEFGQFSIAGGPFPKETTVNLPAVQTYADGEVDNWNQPEGPDGAEPEHPAPTLTLAEGSAGDAHSASHGASDEAQESTSDDTARILGGVALVLGALGAVIGVGALVRRGKAADKSGNDDA